MINIDDEILLKIIGREPLCLIDIDHLLNDQQCEKIKSSNFSIKLIDQIKYLNYEQISKCIDLFIKYEIYTGLLPIDYYIRNKLFLKNNLFLNKDHVYILGCFLDKYIPSFFDGNPRSIVKFEYLDTIINTEDDYLLKKIINFFENNNICIVTDNARQNDFLIEKLSYKFMFDNLNACFELLNYNNLSNKDSHQKFSEIVSYFLSKQQFKPEYYCLLLEMTARPFRMQIGDGDAEYKTKEMVGHLHKRLAFDNYEHLLLFCAKYFTYSRLQQHIQIYS